MTTAQKDDIKKILIQSGSDAIELMRKDSSWVITGIDTLVIKEKSISNFFDNFLTLETQTLMTQKQEKWSTYSVDDSTGTHVALVNWNDETVGYFVCFDASPFFLRAKRKMKQTVSNSAGRGQMSTRRAHRQSKEHL